MSVSDWGPFSLAGKNAIVIGAAHGIGYGIVKRFVEAGANVLVADRDRDGGGEAAGRIGPDPDRIASMGADVAEDDAGEAMVSACVDAFGGVDLLVNNAGIFPMAPMMATTPEFFDRVLGVNLRGLAFCSKARAARSSTSPRSTPSISRWWGSPPTTPRRAAW